MVGLQAEEEEVLLLSLGRLGAMAVLLGLEMREVLVVRVILGGRIMLVDG